ncbi:MAG: biopolymer transporter TolR, partial [Mucilaginibacter sp.]|nr:biopolymer transporter TolR [Mucilaginibacter sp.]
MKRKLFYLIAFLLTVISINYGAIAQTTSLGIFDSQSDVGYVKPKGTVVYNPQTQQYTLSGAGANMWFNHDAFHFLWKRMKGNFILRANVQFIGKGAVDHRKIGWMVRSTLDSNSKYVDVAVHGVKLTAMQYRTKTNDSTHEVVSKIEDPNVVQLERKGDIYTMSVARKGEPFSSETFTTKEIGDEVYVGLFICSHSATVTERAIFSNVRIVVPAKPDFVPYKDYIGSNIEILDMATQNSKVIYQYDKSIQAPNWTRDGKSLIYNKDDLLYNFDLATSKPTLINT